MFRYPVALFHFKDIGVEVVVLAGLGGPTVWNRMFPDGQPSAEAVLPFQLRSVIATQMRRLASALSGTEYAAARKAGTERDKKQGNVVKVIKAGKISKKNSRSEDDA